MNKIGTLRPRQAIKRADGPNPPRQTDAAHRRRSTWRGGSGYFDADGADGQYAAAKLFLGGNHRDTTKPKELPLVMAVDRPEDWAVSTRKVICTGHATKKPLKLAVSEF